MNEETLRFICWITGHDEETIKQMYSDYSSSPQAKSIPMQLPVILQKCENKEKVKIAEYILEKEKEGKLVVNTIEGLMEANIDDLILNQPVEGLLYDLNRDGATILTFIEDEKWINDYACNIVIRRLKALLSK